MIANKLSTNEDGLLIVLVILRHCTSASLELFDLDSNVGLALGMRKSRCGKLERLCLPVLGFLCGLECGIFPDSGVCIGEDLLEVLRTNAIRKVSRELLFKSGN